MKWINKQLHWNGVAKLYTEEDCDGLGRTFGDIASDDLPLGISKGSTTLSHFPAV